MPEPAPFVATKTNGEEGKVEAALTGAGIIKPLDVGKKQASTNEETANSSSTKGSGANGEASTNSAKLSPIKTAEGVAALPPI